MMKLPKNLRVFGDINYRGDCPVETIEQITFINRLRSKYPDTWGILVTHTRNEGKKYKYQAMQHIAEGQNKGASDIFIPAAPAFIAEMKRRDHTKSKISDEQIAYLIAAQRAGAFVCIALGVEGAQEAFNEYLATRDKTKRAHPGGSGR